MTERYYPAASIEAKRTLRKESKPVLTEEFALRVNEHLGGMEDDAELSFFAPWGRMIDYLARKEGRTVAQPTEEFTKFMEDISHQERIQLKLIIDRAYHIYDIRTVGEMRNFVVQAPQYTRWIGVRGRAFASLAFQKRIEEPEVNEAENLTLGL